MVVILIIRMGPFPSSYFIMIMLMMWGNFVSSRLPCNYENQWKSGSISHFVKMCSNLYGGALVDRPRNTKDKAAGEVWHILAADENPLIDVVPEVNLFIRLWDEYIWKLWTFSSDNCSVTDWWMFKFCYCCWVSLIGDCRESFEHLIRDTKQQIHMQDSLNFVIYVLTLMMMHVVD